MRQLPCKHIYAVIFHYFSLSRQNQYQQLLVTTQQQSPIAQQQLTIEELCQRIQKITKNINDLDIA
ncbi:928_t:CDS:1, partial [Cetraspora pellucida]